MKKRGVLFFAVCVLYAGSALAYASSVRTVLRMVEKGIQGGSAKPFEYVLGSSMSIQIADTIWSGISSIHAVDLLDRYFSRIDSIDFHLTNDFNWGIMKYKINGNWRKSYVIVGFRYRYANPEIAYMRFTERPYKQTYGPGRL